MKNILCFGDSNTYGKNPNGPARWERHIRWTGRLQSLLGDDYYVIEEGLNGRTTIFDDPMVPGRSGIHLIGPLLRSHAPLDLVIVMLGTNDTKRLYNVNAGVVGNGLEYLVKEIKKTFFGDGQPCPEILLVSPILIAEDIDKINCRYSEKSPAISKEFGKVTEKVAKALGTHFFDAASVAEPGPDGMHMDAKDHEALALALEKEVKKLLG